jgi:hypothetical protein
MSFGKKKCHGYVGIEKLFNPLTPELNPTTERCLTRFFTGGFAS